jgi:hypothetical protein
MDVALFCLVLIGLAAFVAAPLYRPRPASSSDDPARSVTEARRQALDGALSDLEIDRASGLLDEASYALERGPLEAEVARLPGTDQPAAD